MTDRELMQQALDYIVDTNKSSSFWLVPESNLNKLVKALRERLAQPEQEPVATVTSESGNPNVSMSWWHEPALPVGTKIYTSPQLNKQWVGLTDEELEEMHNEIKVRLMGTYRTEDIYRSIEAKLREKNT